MLAANIKGYTLLEMLVTMVIAAVLLAVAVPSFTSFIKNNRILAETNGLMTVIKTARSEAMTQRTFVTVCNSDDGSSCSGDWKDGYIAFLDTDGDGTVDAGETVILRKSIEVTNLDFTYSGGNFIRFTSRGRAIGSSGTMTLCDDRGSTYARSIVIAPIGRSSPVGGGTC